VPKYAGKSANVYLSTSGTGAATHLLSVTDWTLNMETQSIDVTDFDSTNQEFIQGWPNRAGTLAGWWRDDEDKLYQAIESADGCNIYLYPTRLAPSKYFGGPAWLSGTVEVQVNGAVRFTGRFSPRGTWVRN
jgi:hypothetical protein